MPAIVEADDDGLYVLKFRGAGQGPKALIAELTAGKSYYRPVGIEHNVINANDYEFVFVEIEFKAPQA